MDLSDTLLAQGRALLGGDLPARTVDRAFAEAIALELRLRHFGRLRTLDGLDLADEEVMVAAWRTDDLGLD